MIRSSRHVLTAALTALVLSATFAVAGYHDHALDENRPSGCPDCALTLCSVTAADNAVSVHACPSRAFLTDLVTTTLQDGPASCAGSRAPPATR